jgi:hypothetical protein
MARKSPSERLHALADLYHQRNMIYGDKYLTSSGKFLSALFPDGLKLKTEEEWGRFYLFLHIVSKLDRYATNLKSGGHEDSLDDTAVYCMMLREYDDEVRTDRRQEENREDQ